MNTSINVKTSVGGYDIAVQRGALNNIKELIKLDRKVLVVTDDGVPSRYSDAVVNASASSVKVVLKQGESSKSLDNFAILLRTMVENGFTRSDCVVAVGGGVVGDISGFAASAYMRGIDFYNIPTTLLSQVDSSIGGKTAVDFMGIKNIVGAFYPPKKVVIDPETLSTLPKRQIANGLAESLKMSLTNDPELFEIFENGDVDAEIDNIIVRSLLIKKNVVEADERESGLRRVLNFGHTLAHGVETANGMENYYHGECVAMGMVPMCAPAVRERLLPVLRKLSLPSSIDSLDVEAVISACSHDKKLTGGDITVVYVPEIGKFEFKKVPFSEFEKVIKEAFVK